MTFMPVETMVVLCSLGVGLAVLGRGWTAVRRTTLLGPWSWAVAAFVTWALVELAVAVGIIGSDTSEAARFAGVALSFCPIVAVLGAKRPQHAAWSFVVLSLWAIVALPAAENFVLHAGQKLSLGDARAWFLWILVALGPINYGVTRFGFAALILAAAQVVALGPYLALVHRPAVAQPSLVGLVLAVGALLAAWTYLRGSGKPVDNALDRAWLEFRDAYGLLWGLRVAERFNAVAQQNRWGVELTWSGFRVAGSGEAVAQINSAIEEAVAASLHSLLRRFGSNEKTERQAS